MTRAELDALMDDGFSFRRPEDLERAVELALRAAEAERDRISRKIEAQPWLLAIPYARAVREDRWDV